MLRRFAGHVNGPVFVGGDGAPVDRGLAPRMFQPAGKQWGDDLQGPWRLKNCGKTGINGLECATFRTGTPDWGIWGATRSPHERAINGVLGV